MKKKKLDDKKINKPHIYFSQREDKTNTMEELVFDKFSNDGNLYLTKNTFNKTAYIILNIFRCLSKFIQ